MGILGNTIMAAAPQSAKPPICILLESVWQNSPHLFEPLFEFVYHGVLTHLPQRFQESILKVVARCELLFAHPLEFGRL